MNGIIEDLYAESQYQQHVLGQMYIDPNGDKFRYVQFGATAITAGILLQEPAEDTNFRSMACQAAVAIGDTMVPVTLGGTAVTANMFQNGFLYVESSTGIGQNFRIVRHEVQTSTTGTCKFYLNRAVKIALTTSSQITVRKNPYHKVIPYPVTTQTGGAAGVALYSPTASYYGWIQSGGDVPCLFDTGTNTSNGVTAVQPSQAVAGSVEITEDAAGAQVIGYAREVVSVDSTMGLVHLQID